MKEDGIVKLRMPLHRRGGCAWLLASANTCNVAPSLQALLTYSDLLLFHFLDYKLATKSRKNAKIQV